MGRPRLLSLRFAPVRNAAVLGPFGPQPERPDIPPLLRVDLSMPAVERLGLFLEWGGRWMSASTNSEEPENPDLELEYSRSEWSTVASEDILAGMAWTF